MIIEILFNEIKNIEKLYHKDIEDNFRIEYIGKEYCTKAMDSIKAKITSIKQIEYKGALERIANEVFELSTDMYVYTVSCTIDTYTNSKARMLIKIDAKMVAINTLETYDSVLEKLKLEIKNTFRSDWKSCVWIKDEQSEFLCSNLYPYIFRTENRLRAFANKLLIWELGSDWLSSPGLEKYKESHKKLSEDFRSNEPAFVDVDDVFISATLETLFEIIKKGIVYESPFQLDHNEFNVLMNILTKKNNNENISQWIKKRRQVKKNLWEDIFEPYFGNNANSQQIITDFIKNRNHIAHNKPITFSAYETMKKSFIDLDDMVKNANEKFEESVPSEELYLTIDIENEQAREVEEQEEFERNYLRDRIESETGVEILWHDSILDIFIEKMDFLYETVYDSYYWDSRFTISSKYYIENDGTWQTLFSVKCNANEEYFLDVQAEIDIDDEMDGNSTLKFRYIIHGEDNKITHSNKDGFASAEINYHNGSGYENSSEGFIIELESESYLDDSQMDCFLKELYTTIEELNPYISIKEAMETDAVKLGNDSVVADFPCCECEKYGVSLRDDFYKFGHCCYCGSDNEISICKVCKTPFGDGGGFGICNRCSEYMEDD